MRLHTCASVEPSGRAEEEDGKGREVGGASGPPLSSRSVALGVRGVRVWRGSLGPRVGVAEQCSLAFAKLSLTAFELGCPSPHFLCVVRQLLLHLTLIVDTTGCQSVFLSVLVWNTARKGSAGVAT